MVVASALLIISLILLLNYLWSKRKFINLAYQLPFSDHKYNLQALKDIINADGKKLFEMAYDSIKNVETISKTFHGPLLLVVLEDPDDVKLVMTSKDCLDKSSIMKFANINQGSLFGTLEAWQRHRKIMDPYFGALSMKNFMPLFNEKSLILTKNLSKYLGKKEFDIFHDMTALTLETVLNAMELDIDIQNMDEEERDIPIKCLELGTEMILMRVYKFWLHNEFFYKRSIYSRVYDQHHNQSALQYAQVIIDKIRKEQESENVEDGEKPKTFIRALMHKKYDLSDEEIGDEIKTMLVAAQDTTAISVSSSLLLLAMHKDVQNKLVEEIRHVMPSKAAHFDIEMLSKLPYLEMVINESLRIFPVVPFVTRQTTGEVVLSGYTIPAKTELLIPIIKLHTNKKFWGDDAHLFKPERFEKERMKNIHPFAYIPFTKGPRMCIGYKYALNLMKVNLAHLLMHYEFDTRLKFEELEFKLVVTLNVCQGYQLKISERNFEKE